MKIPFGLVLVLLLLLSAFALVECALDHKIVAGGLVDPITGIDAVDFKFKYPSGGCVNPSTGDVFLSDADTSSKPSTGFNRVFKVNAQTNVITTYAGNGFSAVTSGDGGLAINAGMTPSLCTVDISGDLYLFDAYSNSIRVVNGTSGKISTLTTFTTTPLSIASDDTYIYYSINFSIGKVNKFTKAITTISNAVNAYVTVDPNGVLYYSSSKTVTKRVPGGVSTIIAGKTDSMCASNTQTCGDDGLATDALLSQPTYLHVQDNGNVIILDGKRMRMVSTNGTITTLIGTGSSNSGSACGGATGDGSLARTATIDSAKFLFGFNNTVYFDDLNKFRFRKVENEIVNAAFGVCEKSIAVGQGNKLIDTTFNGNIPYMAFDSQDNIYISARDTIFKVANGILKRIAGSEVGDYGDNGNALNALISSGKIVLNSNNDVIFPMATKIKKVETSTGLIKQFNITGLTSVKAVCLDASENLIIVDSCALKYFDIATQQVSQLSKSNSFCDPGTSGSFINQTLLIPYDCAVDKNTGDVYISEISKIKVIRKSDDKVYTVAGTGTACNKANYISNKCGDGDLATNAKLSVNSIALNSETLELFIADLAWDGANENYYSTIRKINLTSGIISTIAGTGSSEKISLSKSYVAYNNGEWADPLSTPILVSTVYVNRGKTFFVDGTLQGFIRTFDSNNRLVSISGHYYSKSIYYNGENLSATESLLCKPTSIAKYNNGDLLFGLTCKTVDKPDSSSVWTTYSRIVKLDSATGKINTIIGNFKEALTPDGLSGLQTSIRPYRTGSNYYPLGVVVNDAGEVIYADSQSSIVRKLNVNGFIETIVGTNVSCANSADSCGDNGDAKLANLNQPTGLFLTTDNVLYIVDTQNNRVRKVENGIITTVIGSGVACPSAGSASCDSSDPLLVKLLSPAAVYVTKSGDVYVADSGNSIIRKLSNGVLSVVASSLNIPTGLFVDEYNNDVYISDKSSTIRKFSKGVLSIYAGTLNNADYSINNNMSFTYPTSILQTNDGILVADTDAGLIRSVKLSCPTGYYGLNCEFFNCFGISSLNSSSCNSVGNCTAPDVCLCKSDYEGSECQFGKCFGISRNSSNVCTGHGSCLSLNTCSCSADYYGDRCELPFCFSIKSNDSSVCSGNGDCIEKDQCSCKNNYLGSMCDIAPCFGISFNDSQVCSGHGSCNSLNNCSCTNDYYGDECDLPYCFSVKSNDSLVCSGNGNCVAKDQCNCNSNYEGSMCEYAPCFGISFNDSQVCSGHGSCNSLNNCSCTNDYYGDECDLPYCFSVKSNDSLVCSGNGNCVAKDQCNCNSNYEGSMCEYAPCFGISFNDSQVCSGHGECTLGNCQCSPNYFGSDCNVTTCYGVSSNDSSVCSGHGLCSSFDQCKCSSGYTGSNCNVSICYGLTADNQNVCSGHGLCSSPNQCSCNQGWNGTFCNVTVCFGVVSTNAAVCYGHGSCVAPEECSCKQGYTGSSCNITSCYGISSNLSTTCSGHGNCNDLNSCLCATNWYGSNCNITTCFGIKGDQSTVCSGHGTCPQPNQCSCQENYYGSSCSVRCDSNTCNGHGNCSSFGSCQCFSDVKNGFWTLSDCSKCDFNMFGENCLVSIGNSSIVTPDGVGLVLQMVNPSANISNLQVNCNNLLSSETIRKLDSPTCRWSNFTSNELIIRMGLDNTIQLGDSLFVNSNFFNIIYKKPIYISVTVLKNSISTVLPDAIISTTSKSFSNCDSIVIQGSESRDKNYRDLNFEWSFVSSPLNSNTIGLIAKNKPTLVLDDGLSLASGNYIVQLVVISKFGARSLPVYHSFKKLSVSMPQINAETNNMDVFVDRLPVIVKKYVSYKSCNGETLGSKDYEVSWAQTSGQTNAKYETLPNGDLVIYSFSSQLANTFTFMATLNYSMEIASTKVTINTHEPNFAILVYQTDLNSTHVTINVESDPMESLVQYKDSVQFNWKCKNVDETSCDASVLNTLAYHSSAKSTKFMLARESSLSIRLSLEITLSGNNHSNEMIVNFPKDETVPIAELVSVSPASSELTTEDILTIQLLVRVSGQVENIDSLITRNWNLNRQPISNNLVLSPNPSQSNYISLDLSKLTPGSFNTLVFNVSSVSSKLFSTFTYSFSLAPNPQPCSCSITPSTGYALETLFTISCPNCLTANTALQVLFTDVKTGVRVPLMDSTVSELTTQLPYTGDEQLPLHFIVRNTKTGAKTETTILQQAKLPLASSLAEVKTKKLGWNAFYRSLYSNDPRRVVFNYISTVAKEMIRRKSANRRNLASLTCLNGGIYNDFTKMCECKSGYKKIDCSMTLSDWNALVSDNYETAESVIEELNSRNSLEAPQESKIASQISSLYHLLETVDENSFKLLDQVLSIFNTTVQDATKFSYITISNSLASTMSEILGLLYKSQLHNNEGIVSVEYYGKIRELLSAIASIKYRNQLIGSSVDFDADMFKLSSTKLYPMDLSAKILDSMVQLPTLMTKYLTNGDMRKSISPRVFKKAIIQSRQTTSLVNNQTVVTIETTPGYSLSLEFVNQNVDMKDKVVSYYFTLTKSNVSFSNVINLSSDVVCESDQECELQSLGSTNYACKCALPSYITVKERVSYSIAPIVPQQSQKITPQISIAPKPITSIKVSGALHQARINVWIVGLLVALWTSISLIF